MHLLILALILPVIPPAILALVIGLAVGASAPVLVAAYHRLCIYIFKKTGVHLPDNEEIDRDIPAVVRALLPILVSDALTGHFDAAELIKAVQDAVAAAGGTPAHVAAVPVVMAEMHPKFNVPGLR